jgi:hypothetical protein
VCQIGKNTDVLAQFRRHVKAIYSDWRILTVYVHIEEQTTQRNTLPGAWKSSIY